MDDIMNFFRESEETFTIYIVEQRFAVGRGYEYFRSFKGKENLIDTNPKMKKRISKILKWIQKRVPDIAGLTKTCFSFSTPLSIADAVTSLSKLFSTEEHQAAGPDVIDPIIIQEGEILPKYLAEVIALNKESILRPTIIILLKDNNFDRAKDLLSTCPHGINVKMIRNSGETELYKVINCGAKSPDEFITSFSQQCFSTCSRTKRDILLNKEWAGDSIVKQYAPQLLQIRSKLLSDEKDDVRIPLAQVIDQLRAETLSIQDEKLIKCFECMSLLFRVFCNDAGDKDIYRAYEIAKELQNPILLASVFQYSFFMDKLSLSEKILQMKCAEKMFLDNQMADHAVYCKNNYLVRGFDTEKIDVPQFLSLQEEALYNTPGLVGMSHILNNTGVALLVTGSPDEAITFFDKALDYAHRPERNIQKFAILSNRIIAKACFYQSVDENELKRTANLILDNMGTNKLPFLAVRYIMNLISVAFQVSPELGKSFLEEYPLEELMNRITSPNTLGLNQLVLQIGFLEQRYPSLHFSLPASIQQIAPLMDGKRNKFVLRYGYNPIFFSTWI